MRIAPTTHDLLRRLGKHVGSADAAPARRLAAHLRCSMREVAALVEQLRSIGIAVCGDEASGYFIAANADELARQCDTFRRAAESALSTEAALRNVPVGQIAWVQALVIRAAG